MPGPADSSGSHTHSLPAGRKVFDSKKWLCSEIDRWARRDEISGVWVSENRQGFKEALQPLCGGHAQELACWGAMSESS